MKTILTSISNSLKFNILKGNRNSIINYVLFQNRSIVYAFSQQKQNKILFSFSQQRQNIFSNLVDKKDIQQKVLEAQIKEYQKDLHQTQKLYGEDSLGYAHKLYQLAIQFSNKNIENKNNLYNKKAQQYFLKTWKIIKLNSVMKQNQMIKNSWDFFIFQYLIARFFYRLEKRQESKHWFELFRKKAEGPNKFEAQALNPLKFYTYNCLAHLYQKEKNHQQAKQCYNKFKQLADLPNLLVQRKYQLTSFRDYAYFQYVEGNKSEVIKILQDLVNITNYRKQEQIQITYGSSSLFQMIGQPLLGISQMQRIQRQIEKVGQNCLENIMYVSALGTCQQVCRKYKIYDRQYDSLKKIVDLFRLTPNFEFRELVLLNYFIKLAEVEIRINKNTEAYETLRQTDQIIKNVNKFPDQYSSLQYQKNTQRLSNNILEKKLQNKYLQILQSITNKLKNAQKIYLNTK